MEVILLLLRGVYVGQVRVLHLDLMGDQGPILKGIWLKFKKLLTSNIQKEYQPRYSDAIYQQLRNYFIKIQANMDSRVSPGALR